MRNKLTNYQINYQINPYALNSFLKVHHARFHISFAGHGEQDKNIYYFRVCDWGRAFS